MRCVSCGASYGVADVAADLGDDHDDGILGDDHDDGMMKKMMGMMTGMMIDDDGGDDGDEDSKDKAECHDGSDDRTGIHTAAPLMRTANVGFSSKHIPGVEIVRDVTSSFFNGC